MPQQEHSARRGVLRTIGHNAVAVGYYAYGKPAGIVLRGFRRDFSRAGKVVGQLRDAVKEVVPKASTEKADKDRRIDVAHLIASHKERADSALAEGRVSGEVYELVSKLTPHDTVRILADHQARGETRIFWCWTVAAASVVAAISCALTVQGLGGALGSAVFFTCLGAYYAVRAIFEQEDLPKKRGLKNYQA